MDAETTMTFKLDGDDTSYEVPEIDQLDMDEWQILYEYASLTLDDFAPPLRDDAGNVVDEEAETERQRRLAQPAFTKALLHVGYQRSHPELKPSQVKAIVGKAKLMSIVEQQLEQVAAILEAQAGDAEVPLDMTSEPESGSLENAPDSGEKTTLRHETSSAGSENGSDVLDDPGVITGIGV